MRKYGIVLVWLSFVAVASAQNFYPKKDAVFGQVVVGGGYETIINIANRGSHQYLGDLNLFRTENGVRASPGTHWSTAPPWRTVNTRSKSSLEPRSRFA